MPEEVQSKQPSLFTDDIKQTVPQPKGAIFPEGVGHGKNVSSRIVLSSNVPVEPRGWAEVPPHGLAAQQQQSRKPMNLKRIRRNFKRFWSRYSLWQYVMMLVLAIVTVLVLNTLTQPTVKPGTTTGPRR